MTQFELWLRACEEFDESLYELQTNKRSETGLYRLTRQYQVGNDFYYEEPVYAVWWHGKNELMTLNSDLAHKKWENLTNEQ